MAEDRPSASPFPPASDADGIARPERPPQLTVLLVEDNSTDIFVIREVLGACGLDLRLEIVRTGQDAVTYFQERARNQSPEYPALVLLDLNLPKVTGIEVLRHIRADARCAQIPVIVVTSSAAESDRTAAARLGADAYFHKPVDLHAYRELGALVKRIVSES